MRMRLLLLLAGLLWACSDSKSKEPKDSGHEHPDHNHDAGHEEDSGPDEPDEDAGSDDAGPDEDAGSGDAGSVSPLGERPPGTLERPPGEKLPDDLKPPGFGN